MKRCLRDGPEVGLRPELGVSLWRHGGGWAGSCLGQETWSEAGAEGGSCRNPVEGRCRGVSLGIP